MRSILALLVVVVCSVELRGGEFVYVSVSGADQIAIYAKDAETGELALLGEQSTNGSPGSLAVSADGGTLFAALRSSQLLASFAIDRETGMLSPRSSTDAKADPAYVGLDATGRWLLSAYYAAGQVAVHEIDAEGKIAAEGVWHETAEKAHAIVAGPDNAFVYVPHTAQEKIFQFHFNAETGELTPAGLPFVGTPAGYGPRHIGFHAELRTAYVDNERDSSVTQYVVDYFTGTLVPRDTVSTLPDDFTGQNSNARLRLSPDGRFVYVSNRGHDSIAAFAVDPDSGRLSPVGLFATEATPRSFDIDPAGKFLYAAGQSSGKVAAYRINEHGELDRFATYEVGAAPWWVLVVSTDRAPAAEPNAATSGESGL